ncbi:DUF2163 domain-containing protein [Xinfangfangia sp. CPCC 101601]|uniref:DUF2163 domain-containing protein n=1 Tax=Pseudogemmobacter lacusdianii TaxID=3069608 RepID=A0ABU0W101_9RHOB|nr:DUF2163 domain-containing protein [Xinfangfangia sp. CPCC 101601]MDQ2067692.1 DUF2163 domain-containing protein [Xinfangfangia sp. CPCC 101601]
MGTLLEHLASGATTTCRAWTVLRRDGGLLGFTDHDQDLLIEGVVYKASSGLTARTLQQGTGLAVDNSEALGALSEIALSDEVLSEADLAAGRYDAAEVRIFLVNWAETAQRAELFRGNVGEVSRSGLSFRAELRGLTEALNQPVGRAYSRDCSAVLGDARCKFDTTQPGYFVERPVEGFDEERRLFRFAAFSGFADRWFDYGRVEVLSGSALGLIGLVKLDQALGSGREIELWHGLRGGVQAGDLLRFTAGCDKRLATCRAKFANLANFRGFPHIPGEDWLTASPRPGQNTGGAVGFRAGGLA